MSIGDQAVSSPARMTSSGVRGSARNRASVLGFIQMPSGRAFRSPKGGRPRPRFGVSVISGRHAGRVAQVGVGILLIDRAVFFALRDGFGDAHPLLVPPGVDNYGVTFDGPSSGQGAAIDEGCDRDAGGVGEDHFVSPSGAAPSLPGDVLMRARLKRCKRIMRARKNYFCGRGGRALATGDQ